MLRRTWYTRAYEPVCMPSSGGYRGASRLYQSLRRP